jgi:TonB family protein
MFFIGCSVTRDNKRLKQIVESDQKDRLENNPRYSANDLQRYKEVLTLILRDSLKTSNDYYNAAIVLQHGDSANDYLKANELAKKAVLLNRKNKSAKTLIAQSWDRYLRKNHQPQWYGTQRFVFKGKEYLQSFDTTKVTDKERISLGVSTLQNKLAKFNEIYNKREYSIFSYVIEDSTIAKLVSEEPVEIIGGVENLFNQIKYPKEALSKKITGKVLIEFTIDKSGFVKDAVVAEGLGYGCDEEALRVIKSGTYKNHSGEDHEMRIRVPFILAKN